LIDAIFNLNIYIIIRSDGNINSKEDENCINNIEINDNEKKIILFYFSIRSVDAKKINIHFI
jgi:hypothetical protein